MNKQNPEKPAFLIFAGSLLSMLALAVPSPLIADEPASDIYLIGGGGGGGAGSTGGGGGTGATIDGKTFTNGGGVGNANGGGGGGGYYERWGNPDGYNFTELTGGVASAGIGGAGGYGCDDGEVSNSNSFRGKSGTAGATGIGGRGCDMVPFESGDGIGGIVKRMFIVGGNAGSDGTGGKSGNGGRVQVAEFDMSVVTNQLHLIGGNGSINVNGTPDKNHNSGGLVEAWLFNCMEDAQDLIFKVTDEANPHDLHLNINSGKAYQGYAGGVEFGARSLVFEGARRARIDIINDTANGGGQYDSTKIEVRVKNLDLTKLSGTMTINAEFKPDDYNQYYTRGSADGMTPVPSDPVTITFGALLVSNITGPVYLDSAQGIKSHHLFTGLVLHNTGTFAYFENGSPAPFFIKEGGELKLLLPSNMSGHTVSPSGAAPMGTMAIASPKALWAVPGGLEIGDSKVTLALAAAAPLQGIAEGDSIQLFSNDTVIAGSFANDEVTFSDGAVDYTMSIDASSGAVRATVDALSGNTGYAKSYLDAYVSGLIALNNGYDQILTIVDGFKDSSDTDDFEAFASAGGGSIKTKTGSHVDSDAFTFIAGVRYKKNTIQTGAFFESGWGDYDSHNTFGTSTIHGSGDNSFIGCGVFMHFRLNKHIYADASARAGKTSTDFRSDDMGNASFDSDSTYYGTHAGLGFELTSEKGTVFDLNAKVVWTRQKGDTLSPSANETIDFDAASSLRSRLGARYTVAARRSDGSRRPLRVYAGAAWEHEFKGEQNGAQTVGDTITAIKAPDFGGSTAIGELGAKWNISERWQLDATVRGLAGKREGAAGSLTARLAF